MEFPSTFGEWLRHNRNDLKLTREAFAGRIGCSVALLRKIEDGERRPSVQIAELMANSLNIPAEERAAFVKVARGELNVGRLPTASRPISGSKKSPARTNLPVLPTPLIGRQREIEDLGELLRDANCRLLTLVGPGGIGKTRLAIETAAQSQAVFEDGVFFVPLAPVSSTRFIVPVIADAIGFSFQGAGQTDPQTQLFNYLKEKQLLLLIDNLEHLLIEEGILVLAELLANAPRVKLLATSRESLSLQGEWVFSVQGLPIPDSESAPESVQNTSVELFLQRARRADVGFIATTDDYPIIVRICRLVDGMPLGIELAAAWVRSLSCVEIAQEIERGLDFLHVSTRDLPVRHRSMRAVFDHSWKLLNEEEQEVLLQLTIFQGGFRKEAAKQVAGAKLPVLSSLVAKSLVRRSDQGRYDLHELIRQFAAEHFAEHPEDQAAAKTRHSRYFLAYFALAEERLCSAAQPETLSELIAELDNFRGAWDWAVQIGKFEWIERSLRTFETLYDIRSWWQEGMDTLSLAASLLEKAHELSPEDRTIQAAWGHILTARSLLTSRIGQYDFAQEMLEMSMDILRPLDEPRILAEAVTFLGMVMELTGNYARALELYSEGLEIAKRIDDRWYAALCFTLQTGLVGITQSLVKLEVTYARFQAVMADWRSIGDPRFIAIGLNNLSLCALWLGLFDEARSALEESVALCLSIGERWGLSYAYRGLGNIAQVQGEHQQALDLFRKSLDTLIELGARQDVARVKAEMSRSIFALGDDAETWRTLRESLRIAIETKGWFIVMEALTDLAGLQARRGNPESAFELVLVVLDHPFAIQDARDRAARLRSELEAQLSSRQIEAIQARVQSKTIEVIVNEILNLDPMV